MKRREELNTRRAFALLWRYLVTQKGKITAGIIATMSIGLAELMTGALLKFLTNTVTRIQGFAQDTKPLKVPVKLEIDFQLFNWRPRLIDTSLTGAEEILRGIVILSLVFFILYILQGLFQYLREVFMNLAIERVLQKFKSDIFRAVLGSPVKFLEKNSTGDIISRVNYDVTVLTETINILIEISRFVIYLLMFVPAMFLINVKFAIYTVIFYPVSFIIIRYVAKVIKRSSLNVSDTVGSYTMFLEERINRLGFIKVNRTESYEQERFDGIIEKNYQYRKRLIFQRFFLKPSNEVLGMLVLAILFIFFSRDLLAGTGSVGDIAFFLYLVKTSFKPVKKVAQAVGDLNMALISTAKIEKIFELEKERPSLTVEFPDNRITGLKTSGLSFSYNGTDVLRSVDLEVKAGEKILITGETGAGKTTLCSLFPLLIEPGKGTIFLNNRDIMSLSPYQVRSKISFVSGETPLIAGTVWENLIYGTDAEAGDMEKFRGFLPDWVYTDPGRRISGDEHSVTSGEARKISLVRALLRRSDLLILDEAFSYMDDLDIIKFISYVPSDALMIIVSRNPVIESLADRVYLLDRGKLSPAG